VANNMAGGMPFARDIASGLMYKRRGITPAPLSIFDMVMNLIDGKDKGKRAVELIGFVTRIFPKPVVDLFFSGGTESSDDMFGGRRNEMFSGKQHEMFK